MKPAQKVTTLEYHRNGITGLGFHVALVETKDGGKSRTMLVVRFPKGADEDTGNVVCAAFDIADLAVGDIQNAWRGDHFHEVVDAAISRRYAELGE